MGVTRRRLLHVGGLGLIAAACPEQIARAVASAPRTSTEVPPLLVVIFLRGAADGLHLVAPTGEQNYGSLRGALALDKTLPFVRGFGLHPAFAPLAPLVERNELAVVHAVGAPEAIRSHFEAQDWIESGAPYSARVRGGWLARGLGVNTGDPFATLAIAPDLPLSLRGSGAFAMTDIRSFGIPGLDDLSQRELEARYAVPSDDPVALAGRRALEAIRSFDTRLGADRRRGVLRRPGRVGTRVEESVVSLLALEAAGFGIEAAVLESGGWDTHVNQGRHDGAMANWIGDLARGIALLTASLRGRRDVRIVVMTEFGRTVRPNGARGSDHGHGSVMLLIGQGCKAGLHGDWKGLRESQLYQGRDLAVTTDWRSPLYELLRAHRGSAPPADTFPGFTPESIGVFS